MGTNIAVSDQVWSELNSRKRPGESFDDVLRRVLNVDSGESKETVAPPTTPPTDTAAAAIEIPDDVPANKDPDAVRALVVDALALLEAEEQLYAREFIIELFEAHPFDYDVDAYREAIAADDPNLKKRGWWRRVLKPCLETHPDAEMPTGGHTRWRWVGED